MADICRRLSVFAWLGIAVFVACVFVFSGSGYASQFTDRTGELGLTLANSAACWVDFDNDGWVDLCTGGVLWKNNEGKGFTKFAEIGTCVAGDFDNDGWVDFFSWSGPKMKLYRNNEGKSFTEFPLPELPKCVSRGACWADLDNDGFIDLYIGGYEDWSAGITYPDMILMNRKGKSFELTWQDSTYRARGVTACDFNGDRSPDIYVSNYRLQPNLLLINDGKGNLQDKAERFGAQASSKGFKGGHSIGAVWADFDCDGYFDIFAGNFAHVDSRGDQPKSRFLRNLGPKGGYFFEDMGECGVFYQESYASPAAADYNNDGLPDLFFTTVYDVASFNKVNNPVLYRNEGGFLFADKTAEAKLSDLPPTCQAAWADFNNDGHLDLVTAGKLFVNRGNSNNWIKVSLEGDGHKVNRSAIGAVVRIKLKKKVLTRQVEAGTGEGNQNDLTLHFGLGSDISQVNIEITWPNGRVQKLKKQKTNRTVSVTYNHARALNL